VLEIKVTRAGTDTTLGRVRELILAAEKTQAPDHEDRGDGDVQHVGCPEDNGERGHGQSDAPFSQYTMPELVEDIRTIAEALALPKRFILVGHSFGGSICAEYAKTYPERLGKLILISTAGEYPLPWGASLLSRVPAAVFRPWWKYRPRWNAEIHVMKRMMLNNMRKWQGWSTLRNIHTPTLVITGERDRYFPRHVFEEVSRAIPRAATA
jgi:pimeloyl-ACP methyl ester carboxylesterase